MLGRDVHMKPDPVLLTPDNERIVRGFNCGADGMNFNEYLANEAAVDNEARTYVYVTDENEPKPVAYFSIACSMLVKGSGGDMLSSHAPAVMIDKYAVAEEYHHMDYRGDGENTLAQMIFFDVQERISDIACKVIGAKYIVLFSTPKAHNFYLKCGFEDLDDYLVEYISADNEGCIPMFTQL